MYTVAQAERWTRKLAHSHYENFLVVSWLLPRRLHQPMFNIYAYCRGVDDLGDEAEGDRLALLDGWQRELEACYAGTPEHPAFVALAPTIRQFELPIERFELSDATCTALQLANFWQDVARDYKMGRIYLPLEDMRRFGCTEAQIAA